VRLCQARGELAVYQDLAASERDDPQHCRFRLARVDWPLRARRYGQHPILLQHTYNVASLLIFKPYAIAGILSSHTGCDDLLTADAHIQAPLFCLRNFGGAISGVWMTSTILMSPTMQLSRQMRIGS
jgi:hypothetical protein